MSGRRLAAAIMISIGLAAVGVALAFLYKDFVGREGAWVEIHSYDPHQLTDQRRDEILDAWRGPDNTFAALIAGCAGVALFSGGVMVSLFESRWFMNRQPETTS